MKLRAGARRAKNVGNQLGFRRSAARGLIVSAIVALALAAGPRSGNAGSAQCGPGDGLIWIPTNFATGITLDPLTTATGSCPVCSGSACGSTCSSGTLPCYQNNANCADKDPIDFPSFMVGTTDHTGRFGAIFLFNGTTQAANPFTNHASLSGTLTMVMTNDCPSSTTDLSPSPCIQSSRFTGTVGPTLGSSCPSGSASSMTLFFAGGALNNCKLQFCTKGTAGMQLAGTFSSTGPITMNESGGGICAPANTKIAFNCHYSP